jgi:hypothetical protein
MNEKIRLFISWSGKTSRSIAESFKDFLLVEFKEQLDVFFTPDDIEAGKRWSSELAQKLQECEIGIFIYTRQNLDSLWMAFEAGALSKQIDTGRVIPLVFGTHVTDLIGPLAQFQAKRFTREEISKTLQAIDGCLSKKRTKEDLNRFLNFTWDNFEKNINAILSEEENTVGEEKRDVKEVLDSLYTLIQASPVYNVELAKDITELVQQVTKSHDEISELMQQVRTTLRGSYIFIDGEKPAFAAIIAATIRAKKYIRSTRFSPMAISGNQDDYGQAIFSRVVGANTLEPVDHYTRIIAANNIAKLQDIDKYLESFRGKNFDLYLTKKSQSFEMVIIDEEEIFIHFYGQGQVIRSTLNIVGSEVTKNFINVYHQLHDPKYDPDIFKIEFKYIREDKSEIDRLKNRINEFFQKTQTKK